MNAALHKQIATVRYLCEVGKADVNQRCGHGLTALHRAAYVGAHDVVCYLCKQHNADVLVVDDRGATPRFSAGFGPVSSVSERNMRKRVMEYLRAREIKQARTPR